MNSYFSSLPDPCWGLALASNQEMLLPSKQCSLATLPLSFPGLSEVILYILALQNQDDGCRSEMETTVDRHRAHRPLCPGSCLMLCHERRVGCPGSPFFPLASKHSRSNGRASKAGARSHGKGTGYCCKGGGHRKVTQSQRELGVPLERGMGIMTPFETLGPEDGVWTGRAESVSTWERRP